MPFCAPLSVKRRPSHYLPFGCSPRVELMHLIGWVLYRNSQQFSCGGQSKLKQFWMENDGLFGHFGAGVTRRFYPRWLRHVAKGIGRWYYRIWVFEHRSHWMLYFCWHWHVTFRERSEFRKAELAFLGNRRACQMSERTKTVSVGVNFANVSEPGDLLVWHLNLHHLLYKKVVHEICIGPIVFMLCTHKVRASSSFFSFWITAYGRGSHGNRIDAVANEPITALRSLTVCVRN